MSESHGDPFANDYLVDDGDPKWTSTLYVGAVGGFLLIVTVVGLIALFNVMVARETEKKRINVPINSFELYNNTQLRELNSYGWVDREKETVHIPIERAMELTLRDAGAKSE